MNALLEIFINPSNVYEAQKEDSYWLTPALAILGVSTLCAIAMYMTMDLADTLQAQIEDRVKILAASGASQESIDQSRLYMESMAAKQTSPLLTIVAWIFNEILFFAFMVLNAVYYLIVGKILKTGFVFSAWLAFSVWGLMPYVVGDISVLIAVLVMAPQADPQNYLWTALFNYVALPNQGATVFHDLLNTLDLFLLWVIAIMTIGFSKWTERGFGTSLAVVAMPYVVVYGILLVYAPV